jgi:hypothetical protein
MGEVVTPTPVAQVASQRLFELLSGDFNAQA